MIARGTLAIIPPFVAAVALALVATRGGATAEPTGGRRPPAPPSGVELRYSGHFENSVFGDITLETDGESVTWAGGIAPGPCKTASGGVQRHGAIFQVRPNARISPQGSFAFTARPARHAEGGLPDHIVTVRGTFYGNNAVGNVRATSGKEPLFTGCKGQGRFWAKREG